MPDLIKQVRRILTELRGLPILRAAFGAAHSYPRRHLSAQLVEQRLGVLQGRGVEALGEPVVDIGEHRAGLGVYFRVQDNVIETEQMPNAELRPIPSIWGHAAGLGVNPADNSFIDAALLELLAG